MKLDGFDEDITMEQANRTHIKFVSAPDYFGQSSAIEEAWNDIAIHKPNLRHEMARIAFEYGGTDAQTRAHITKSMLSLYIVLKEAQQVESSQNA